MSSKLSMLSHEQDGPPLSELLPGLSTAVRALARAAKNVPEASDIYYYKNIPDYKQLSNACSSRAQTLLAAAATHLTRPLPAATKAAAAAAAGGGAGSAVDDDDGDEPSEVLFERLTSLLDDTYERLDTALDVSKQQTAALKAGGWAIPQHSRQPLRAAAAARGLSGSSVARVAGGAAGRIQRHVADLARPQDVFPDPVDNSAAPWTPGRFPHLVARLAAAAAADGGSSGSSSAVGVHPYMAELSRLQYQPWQLHKQMEDEQSAEQGLGELDAVPCTLVDTPEGLAAMVEALQGERQLAIDLEHHSYRSYQGFTCLLQLSNRTADWVVDTLALRAHLGPALSGLLADPQVEKVLHGADNDILWLQRDFGLYIVNMFDTGQAARVLAYPSASLAHLLERHVGFSADKRYQLADWRLRPLPDDMLHYARADTHYLLAVSDRLKDELRVLGERMPPSWAMDLPPHSGTTGSLGLVFERSRQLCLHTYSKPALTPTSHLDAALRWGLALPPRNMSVFGALYCWRDRTARALDESVHYVMPKGVLLELSRAMPTTAAEVRKLLGQGSGLSGGSGLLLSRAEEVAQIVVQGQTQLTQRHEQQPAAAAADGSGSEQQPGAPVNPSAAAAAAAVVKPRELPALVPRKVGAVGVKAASKVKGGAGSAGGMRGVFGRAGGSTAVTIAKHQQQQQQQDQEPEQSGQQPPAGPAGVLPTDDHHQQVSQDEPDEHNQDQQEHEQPQEQEQIQKQQPQQPPLQLPPQAAVTVGSGPAPKALPPARKSNGSLAGLFSRKRSAGAVAVPTAKKAATFKVDFLVVQPEAPAAAGAGGEAAAGSGAAAAAAGTAALGKGSSCDADEQQQQQQPVMQRVTAADVRAAVDMMVAEGGDGSEGGGSDNDSGAAVAVGSPSAVAVAANDEEKGGEGSNGVRGGGSGFGDMDFIPLSEQRPGKKAARKAAAAAAVAAGDGGGGDSGSHKQQRVQEGAGAATGANGQEQQNHSRPRKSKGIFDGMGGSDSGDDSSSSDLDDGASALPSFDPNRLAAAAAARADKAGAGAGDDKAVELEDSYRGRGGKRGRGRGRGAGGKRDGRQGGGAASSTGGRSLAAVRKRQGGGDNVGINMFQVQDGPFKSARRKAVHGGKSRTFK